MKKVSTLAVLMATILLLVSCGNMKSVPAGVYLLRVMDADGKEYHRKIVKR